MNYTTADTIKLSEHAEIVELDQSGSIGRRLSEMGFWPGKEIVLLVSAPFGDPLAFRIDNTIIALRKSEAQLIRVRSVSKAA